MSITPYEFFYDAQQRRFLEQIVRAFSGFSYQTGMQGGAPQTILVPCHLALTNRMVANIRANLSENTLNNVPMITIWQHGLRGRLADLQNTAFVEHRQVFERQIVNGAYGPDRGNAYSIERIMPLPFTMEVQVDVWTSNLEQKYQLLEQILVAMYPEFEIQNSDNPLDWTAVTVCFLDDEIEFSSRTVPYGTNDEIDIFALKLRIPIYLTAPAKIKRLSRIEEIVANVDNLTYDQLGQPAMGAAFQRVIVTPMDACISVNGSVIGLLNSKGGDLLPNGNIPSWENLFRLYGIFTPSVSELRLYLTSDIEGPFVTGTLQYGEEPNQIIWTIDPDTLPTNTLVPVDAVIDPSRTFPGQGLPSVQDGTRYILVNGIGSSVAWGDIVANANDIIQYSSTNEKWTVSFDSSATPQSQFVLNLYTGSQLNWNGAEWVMSIDQFYEPGYWRLAL